MYVEIQRGKNSQYNNGGGGRSWKTSHCKVYCKAAVIRQHGVGTKVKTDQQN